MPASLGAALAALRIIASDEGPPLFARVLENARHWSDGLRERGFKVVEGEAPGDVVTPIVPVLVEDDWKAALLWKALWDAGVFVNVALHPAVPPGGALLRTSVMATHDAEVLDRALDVFSDGEGGVRGRARPAARARLSDPSLRSLVRRSSTLSRNGLNTKCSL